MNNFKCLDRICYAETLYKQFIFDYIKIMNNLNDDNTNYYYYH